MTKLSGASVARLVLLLVGLAGLAWAVILPTNECKKLSADYGVCSDNSALIWELAVVGAILVAVAVVSYLIARRRAPASSEGRPVTFANPRAPESV